VARPFLQFHHRFKNGKDHCSWSIAEKVRTRGGWVQRHLLYLGEINDSQKAAWTKVTEVFDTERDQTRPLALYPADRAVPAHAAEYVMLLVQIRFHSGSFITSEGNAQGYTPGSVISSRWSCLQPARLDGQHPQLAFPPTHLTERPPGLRVRDARAEAQRVHILENLGLPK
jgi:hypothetical protein